MQQHCANKLPIRPPKLALTDGPRPFPHLLNIFGPETEECLGGLIYFLLLFTHSWPCILISHQHGPLASEQQRQWAMRNFRQSVRNRTSCTLETIKGKPSKRMSEGMSMGLGPKQTGSRSYRSGEPFFPKSCNYWRQGRKNLGHKQHAIHHEL